MPSNESVCSSPIHHAPLIACRSNSRMSGASLHRAAAHSIMSFGHRSAFLRALFLLRLPVLESSGLDWSTFVGAGSMGIYSSMLSRLMTGSVGGRISLRRVCPWRYDGSGERVVLGCVDCWHITGRLLLLVLGSPVSSPEGRCGGAGVVSVGRPGLAWGPFPWRACIRLFHCWCETCHTVDGRFSILIILSNFRLLPMR